ncbi:MAG: tRNA (adenosine(37)-N6)-threonylcarbamoyltransferase complex transferase subunit TsaD [Phycisphaerae bacterium]|nr:tRNA (adenosine(37)-N6)-threonylcarbamoyltransferase complex transferase subunit TsaD [Phycisphaerae bacterium]
MTATRPLILAIESSCDETAAAVVRDGREVLADIVATQHDLHERYKGVVPEIASRAHVERIVPVVREALATAGVDAAELDAVAVGHRPGLIGSLLVGVSAAKAIAWSLGVPFLGVDHVAAHLFAGLLEREPCAYPALGLVVSGGHTSLYLVRDPLTLVRLGATIDDAIGEAFDKAATILGLGYPGGPKVDALARRGNDRAHDLPLIRLRRDESGERRLDFSFSGLKTALLYATRGVPERRPAGAPRGEPPRFPRSADLLDDRAKADLAASFERVAVEHVLHNVREACRRHRVATLLVGGGASANTRLRAELADLAAEERLDLRIPPFRWCLDNAAMIGGYAAYRLAQGESDRLDLPPEPLSALR